jgi:hypothetical protein
MTRRDSAALTNGRQSYEVVLESVMTEGSLSATATVFSQWLCSLTAEPEHNLKSAAIERELVRGTLLPLPGKSATTTYLFAMKAVVPFLALRGSVNPPELRLRLLTERSPLEIAPTFIEACSRCAPSRAWVGEPGIARSGASRLTWIGTAENFALPEGAQWVERRATWGIVQAHGTAPADVRRGVDAVVAAFRRSSQPIEPKAESRGAQVEPVPPAPVPLPTNVDETLPIPVKFVSLGLPFSGSLSAEEVTARAAAATPPRAPAEDVNVDETVMLPKQTTSVVVGQGLRERLAPKAIPILSMDEYAEFRAGLTVFGPDHAPTMARFGVGDKMVAEILRQRFAAAFSRDDGLRERFVARLQECVAALRGGGTR